MFFQLWKQVEVTGCQGWTIGWVSDDLPSKLLQESDSLAGSVGSSVVVENAYALAQNPSSPVLNRPPEFCQCLTIPVSVYCGPSSQEMDQQHPLSTPKHSCHYFTADCACFNFHGIGEEKCNHWRDCCFVSIVKWYAQISSPMSIESKKLSFLSS